MLKKTQVMLIPTKKAENCILKHNETHLLYYHNDNFFTQGYLVHLNSSSHHLYIISDNKITTDDFYIDFRISNQPLISNSFIHEDKRPFCRKIIATTNKDLKLPAPTELFVRKWCENYNNHENIIREVLVEYEDISIIAQPSNVVKTRPDNTIIIKSLKTSWSREELPTNILRDVVKYCESQQIYDKLGNHGDFYYKAKKWLETI